jgi:hypothetical protein
MMRFVSYAAVAVFCSGAALRAEEVSFSRHVTPMLHQLGCSAGTCHGSFSGKGGFRLSLFAGNPEMDHLNLRGGYGRRIDRLNPEKSLVLLKPTAAIEHGGGLRLRKDSWQYQLLKAWIEQGARFDPAGQSKIVGVRVEPASLTLPVGAKSPPLKVFAKLADGKEEEVTRFTRFESLDPGLAETDDAGQIKSVRTGDIAVLAHYAGEVGFVTVLIPGPPLPGGVAFPKEEYRDPVDRLLVERLRKLNIVPSATCSDVDFLRRVHLDVIGQLPTPADVRAFLADKDADKRTKVIDKLLEHPLHAALWAGKMCDMVGADDRFLGDGVYQFHDWFRGKLEANTPWDKIAYGVLCATAADERTPERIKEDQKVEAENRKKYAGKPVPPPPGKQPWQAGYATRNSIDVFYSNLINTQTTPGKGRTVNSKQIALRVAHTFLGVRLECAQCHKHPYDRWSQGDFFSFAAVFAHTELGVDPELKAQKVNLNGVYAAQKPVEQFLDPDTQQPVPPRIPGGPTIEVKPGVDARKEVWQWLLRTDNPFFAQAIVNRVWEHYLGRGFVEPADAQAAANPPSHPDVLAELVRDFTLNKYDLRRLHRRILNTLAYQRDWRTNATNAKDQRNFSHRTLRRLTAEQALDAIAQVTDTPVKIPKRYGSPRDGQKAVEIALSRVGGDDGYVLQIFGRPIRVQNCDCERSAATSLSQTMYLFNDEKLIAKIHDDKGRLKKLVQETADDGKLLEELYLWTLTRLPTTEELDRSRKYVQQVGDRLEAYQDLLWSLMNRHEFVVNR